jgi:hypothetical protein
VNLLLLEGNAQAVCRLSLFDLPAGWSGSFPLHMVGNDEITSGQFALDIRVHSNDIKADETKTKQWTLILCIGVAAIALLVAQNTWLALFALAAVCALVFKVASCPTQRHVAFSVDRVENCNVSEVQSPRWVGKWRLDKVHSEPYAPILEDLGVNYLLRKAADAANSVLTISTSPTHVTINIKLWVTLEDCVPLDGSFCTKPVPTGSSIKGDCRIKVVKHDANELQLLTQFPDGHGELVDTLTMSDDGNSFTRVVTKGELEVTRVFRRDRSF